MKKALVIISLVFLAATSLYAEPLVIGYYPAWMLDEYPVDAVDFSVITNIVYAFAWPNENATLDSYTPPASPELIAAAHDAGRGVSISIGGGGNEAGFPTIIADPELRAALIENIFAFCDEHGYDGADFDWEFPTSTEERDNYAALVRELREAADDGNREFFISMALSAASWPNYSNAFGDLNEIVDWFFIMNYDYSGPWTQTASHLAPLYPRSDLGYSLSVSRSLEYIQETQGLEKEKIILGIPFYGRSFNASKLFGPSTGGDAVRYSSIVGEIASETWTEHWDDISKAPYLISEDETKVITYDNEDSVRAKCEWALEQELAGVGIWALGYDYDAGETPLITVIGSVLGATTIVDSGDSDIFPQALSLAGNYPNPFNPSTTISYRLEKETAVSIEVFSIAGQRVAILENNAVKSAGEHVAVFDADGLASGIYCYRLSAEGHSVTGRMTLMR